MIQATHEFLEPKLATKEFFDPPFQTPLKVTYQPERDAKIVSHNYDDTYDVASWVDVRQANGEGYLRDYSCYVHHDGKGRPTVKKCDWRLPPSLPMR